MCSRSIFLYHKPGVWLKTIRALALVAEVIYGIKPSYEDPARYSFAHGGKDGTPYLIDRATYEKTIMTLTRAVNLSKISPYEKDKAISRLTNGSLKISRSM